MTLLQSYLHPHYYYYYLFVMPPWVYLLFTIFPHQSKKKKRTYTLLIQYLRGAFNKFPDFFVQAFKIAVDSWKCSMLLLYILWDDWPIFMISDSNKQLQQELKYTLLNPDFHSWWISKMQSRREEERYAIKFCFKLGKNAMRWNLDLLLWPRDQEFPVEACWLSQTQEG